MNNPLVSVIIATFRRRNLLPIAISSVLKQEYKNIECIVVNDCPEESVDDIIANFSDSRLKIYNHAVNKGLGATRNTGLDYATGDLISFLDDDDKFYPLHLKVLVDQLQKSNERIVYANCVRSIWQKQNNNTYTFINRDIPYDLDYNSDLLLVQNLNPVLGYLFDHKLLGQDIRFREDLSVYEDWVLWLDLARQTDFKHIQLATSEYRWVMDGSTMSSSRDFTTPLLEIYPKYFKYAKDPVWVAMQQNAIMQKRGLPPLYQIVSEPK